MTPPPVTQRSLTCYTQLYGGTNARRRWACTTRRMRIACWMTKATDTPRICNTCCLSTATVVTWRRLCVTFVRRIHCLCCVKQAGIESVVVYSMALCTSDYCPQIRIWFLLEMRQYACARFGGEWRVATADPENILTMHSLGARYS